MTRKISWKPCPTRKINAGLLRQFHWNDGGRAKHLAALMCWVVIVHEANEDGFAKVTYDYFQATTGLGRTSISDGLKVLIDFNIVERGGKLGHYLLSDFTQQKENEAKQFIENQSRPWGKLPVKRLYSGQSIRMFNAMTRRQKAELDALKLFFLIVARRDRRNNSANMTYDQIGGWAGIPKGRVGAAITVLAANHVVLVSEQSSNQSDFGISNSYRLVGVDSYLHRGTALRATL